MDSRHPNNSQKGFWLKVAVCATALVVVACWVALQPSFKPASLEEVRALLPADLLKEPAVDKAAQIRFAALVKLIPSIDERQIEEICDVKGPIPQRYEKSLQFWHSHQDVDSMVFNLLGEGPIQWPSVPTNGLDQLSLLEPIDRFSRLATSSAFLFASMGDFMRSARMLGLAERLGRGLMGAGGDLLQYSTAARIRIATAKAVTEIVGNSKFPSSACAMVLAENLPAPEVDEALVDGIREDFQKKQLRWLPDPTRNLESAGSQIQGSSIPMGFCEPGSGGYDALETTRIFAKVVPVSIANAKVPWSKFDQSGDQLIKKETKDLPERSPQSGTGGGRNAFNGLSYEISMRLTRNSIGRELIQTLAHSGESPVLTSCEWRTIHDVARALLASRIYRASHGGKIPSSSAGLVPILGAWPQDPFNGKPMVYNAKDEVVYSTGKDLSDGGGKALGISIDDSDIGVSLKLKP